MRRYNRAMNKLIAAPAASLLLTLALVCAPALAQRTASPPNAAVPSARGPSPAAEPAGSRAARGSASSASRGERPTPIYRVELVVFRATSALGGPEDWAAEAGTAPVTSTDADPGSSSQSEQPQGAQSSGAEPERDQASSASAGASQTRRTAPTTQPGAELPASVVRLLPASEFQLDSVAARLRASGRYVPVAHIAWAQTASPWGKPVEIPVQGVGLDAQGMTGTVALEHGVFLHLVLDLRYTMDDPPSGLDAPPGTVFVLDESHRVRLRERNYFDHPAFGVIALVTSDQAPTRSAR